MIIWVASYPKSGNIWPKNDYSKLLDYKIKFNIEKKFKKTMKLLNYV